MLSGFGSHSPHTSHCNAESRSRSGLRFIWIRIQRVKIKPQIFRSQGGLPYNTGYGSFHFRSEVVPVSLLKDITFSHIPSLHPTSLLCQLAPSKLLGKCSKLSQPAERHHIQPHSLAPSHLPPLPAGPFQTFGWVFPCSVAWQPFCSRLWLRVKLIKIKEYK